MERKKLFRSVWFWVAIVVVLMFVASSFFRGNSGYDEVPTSTALAQFQDGNVQGFLYGHYQFIVNDRPGLWTALPRA